ncbi:MAG: YifB family Mg chelatase-like AAA ATPase [Treponema sp.]|jgi:magnesium chelatase family protein|nr:YifB family Mg chelatase-like AAA ATPase [Treponema sp.]
MYITGHVPFADGGTLIRVETDIRRGIPGIDISGLAEGAVREARERVRAAFRNSGLAFPLDRILINLAPAGIRKEGAALDLPIALSVMAAAGLVPGMAALPEQLMVLGELELSGRVRPVRGVLAAAAAGLAEGIRFFIVPKENEEEAAVLLDRSGMAGAGHGAYTDNGGIHLAAVSGLDEAAHALVLLTREGTFPPRFPAARDRAGGSGGDTFSCGDFAEVRGQDRYKRALEIAAAGGHNLLVFGGPGAGKTMLARRLPSIMAPLTAEEAVEVTRMYSLAGRLGPGGPEQAGMEGDFSLIVRPPFRSPHHSASAEGILGGGRTVRPGEISLAHLGVLFLDEAPEFKTNVLQALREPLEDRVLTIVRAEGPVKLPADFQLLLAANACPCGRLGSRGPIYGDDGAGDSLHGGCFCGSEEIYRYWRKFGGALLDRVELRVPVAADGIYGKPAGAEPSGSIRRRVMRAVEIQRRRFAGAGKYGGSGVRRNARMSPAQIDAFCVMTEAAGRAFRAAAERLAFSGRACHGVLRTARTIADLEGAERIQGDHILEAVQHRRLGDDPYDVMREPP